MAAERPRFEPEIIPPDRHAGEPDDAERRTTRRRSAVWMFVTPDGQRRVYSYSRRTGPFSNLLLMLAIAVAAALIVFALVGFIVVGAVVVGFVIAAAVVLGLLHRLLRPR